VIKLGSISHSTAPNTTFDSLLNLFNWTPFWHL